MKLSRSHLAALALLAAAALPLGSGCQSGMDPKECDKLRSDAFELVNKAQHCNADPDCKQSEWPGCAKPLSSTNFDKIHGWKEAFAKGQCVEKKDECKPPPESYCKQGLCVHREKGTPEGAGAAPIDQIEVK